jgi:hypothetical protein
MVDLKEGARNRKKGTFESTGMDYLASSGQPVKMVIASPPPPATLTPTHLAKPKSQVTR